MNPLLFIGIALGVGKLISDFVKDNPEFSEIDHESIYTDFLINADKTNSSKTVLKQRLTKSINKVKSRYSRYKIGKTGNPKSRNFSYTKYQSMFLLCSSSNKKLIDSLEAYYNNKYINNKLNDNKKRGSAGKAKAFNGLYYLYIVVRN